MRRNRLLLAAIAMLGACTDPATTERAGPAYSIKGSFLLAPLRGHRRFGALLERMKLA